MGAAICEPKVDQVFCVETEAHSGDIGLDTGWIECAEESVRGSEQSLPAAEWKTVARSARDTETQVFG
jgi:hypothetical protein